MKKKVLSVEVISFEVFYDEGEYKGEYKRVVLSSDTKNHMNI